MRPKPHLRLVDMGSGCTMWAVFQSRQHKLPFGLSIGFAAACDNAARFSAMWRSK